MPKGTENFRTLLGPGEIVLWRGDVTIEAWRKSNRANLLGTLFWVGVAIISTLYLAGKLYSDLSDLHFQIGREAWGPIIIDAVILASILLGLAYLCRLALPYMFQAPRQDQFAALYLITDRRLIAANTELKILDEMLREDMEFVVEGLKGKQLLITRKGDSESIEGFHFELADDLAEAERIIRAMLQESR